MTCSFATSFSVRISEIFVEYEKFIAINDIDLGISNKTERPLSKKLIKQELGLLVTSTGVTRCCAKQGGQADMSEAPQPLGVHHFNVTVSYSAPSFMLVGNNASLPQIAV